MATDDKKTNKPDADDLDLGIDVSTLSEAERAIYDKIHGTMRPAYLKKTSALADERRKWEQEQQAKADEYAQTMDELNKWRTWYQQEGQYLTPRQQREAMREEGLEEPNQLMQDLNALRQQFAAAQQKYDQVIDQLNNRNHTLESAMRLQNDLFDLRIKHPEMDPMRVLTTAKDKGIQSLELAYKLAYDDELAAKRESELRESVEKETRQKVEAEKAVVETSTPSTTRYAPPAEAKSYSEASKNLLGAVRSSSGGSTLTD